MDEAGEIVRKTYNDLAANFDKWAESVRTEERRKYLTKIQNAFPEGSRILDIGCGNGLLNTIHLARHFQMTGIDISDRQIAEARKNLPGLEFVCADIRDHEFTPQSFDGLVSFYCFNHIPRETYSEMLAKCHRWLKPGGLLIASFGAVDTKGWTGEWLGATTFFSSYAPRKTTALVRQNGFEIMEESIETEMEDGSEIPFLWITAKSRRVLC